LPKFKEVHKRDAGKERTEDRERFLAEEKRGKEKKKCMQQGSTEKTGSKRGKAKGM